MTPIWYEIRLLEKIDNHRSHWFAGMEIVEYGQENGVGTLLRVLLPDQAALFGILSQIRNLNLTLLEVRRIG